MKFKAAAYRMGYGKNIRGVFQDNKYILYYKNRDGIVNSKEIIQGAGKVELVKGGDAFNATTVVPVDGGFLLSNKGKEIKSIKL